MFLLGFLSFPALTFLVLFLAGLLWDNRRKFRERGRDSVDPHRATALIHHRGQKTQMHLRRCFAVGEYRLGRPLPSDTEYVRLTAAEDIVMRIAIPSQHEVLVHAPDVLFMGLVWQAVLGTKEARVSSIAVHWEGTADEAQVVRKELTAYCKAQYLRCSSLGGRPQRWAASDGEILFHSRTLDNAHISLDLILDGPRHAIPKVEARAVLR